MPFPGSTSIFALASMFQSPGHRVAARQLCSRSLGFSILHPKARSEEHTSELQSHHDLVCRLLLEKKKKMNTSYTSYSYSSYNTLTTNIYTLSLHDALPI